MRDIYEKILYRQQKDRIRKDIKADINESKKLNERRNE